MNSNYFEVRFYLKSARAQLVKAGIEQNFDFYKNTEKVKDAAKSALFSINMAAYYYLHINGFNADSEDYATKLDNLMKINAVAGNYYNTCYALLEIAICNYGLNEITAVDNAFYAARKFIEFIKFYQMLEVQSFKITKNINFGCECVDPDNDKFEKDESHAQCDHFASIEAKPDKEVHLLKGKVFFATRVKEHYEYCKKDAFKDEQAKIIWDKCLEVFGQPETNTVYVLLQGILLEEI